MHIEARPHLRSDLWHFHTNLRKRTATSLCGRKQTATTFSSHHTQYANMHVSYIIRLGLSEHHDFHVRAQTHSCLIQDVPLLRILKNKIKITKEIRGILYAHTCSGTIKAVRPFWKAYEQEYLMKRLVNGEPVNDEMRDIQLRLTTRNVVLWKSAFVTIIYLKLTWFNNIASRGRLFELGSEKFCSSCLLCFVSSKTYGLWFTRAICFVVWWDTAVLRGFSYNY